MKIWIEDSNFDVNVGDVLEARPLGELNIDYSDGDKWQFKLVSLDAGLLGVTMVSGPEILDGYKPMYRSLAFIDGNALEQEFFLEDVKGEVFLFMLVA